MSRHTFTGSPLNIADLGSDDFKYILQQTSGQVVVSGGVTGDSAYMAKRINDANRQGGESKEPNTQPEASFETFNRSGYPAYTPPAKIAAFVAEFNAWAKANLHQGGRPHGKQHA